MDWTINFQHNIKALLIWQWFKINKNKQKQKIMKTQKTKKYNYFYYGRAISRANFLKAVPENWEDEVNEYGIYSWGGYEAVEIDEDE